MKRSLLIAISLMTAFIGLKMPSTQAQTGPRDCDSNAVINCGSYTSSELKDGWSAHPGVQCLYSHFGILQADVRNIDTNAVDGTVTKTGNVIVDGKVVATNAMTAGRQNMAGSTALRCDGTTFYMRPPSASFGSSSLSAFVVMDNNDRFSFAIINSCGNPVMATQVTPPAKTPAPAPTPTKTVTTTKVVTPTIVVNTPAPAPQTQNQSQSQSQVVSVAPTPTSTTTTTAATTPTTTATTQTTISQPTQAATTAAPATGKTIPNTGPGDVLQVSGFATIFGTIGHWVYQRRRTAV